MDWEYRIIKSNDLDSKKYSIQEVLVDSDGCMVAHSIDFIIESDNVDELEDIMNGMKDAIDKPILPELPKMDYPNSD